MYSQRRAEAFSIQSAIDSAFAQFFPTEQSNAVDDWVAHADCGLEFKIVGPIEFHLPELLNECRIHRNGEERGRRPATEPEGESSITDMSVPTGNFAGAQPITVRRAPIQSVRRTLMDRHGDLGGANTEALDRLRHATNKCKGPEIEMVSECDNAARWRRFEIDRERIIAI